MESKKIKCHINRVELKLIAVDLNSWVLWRLSDYSEAEDLGAHAMAILRTISPYVKGHICGPIAFGFNLGSLWSDHFLAIRATHHLQSSNFFLLVRMTSFPQLP